jgi:hypothetical protein
MNKDDAPPHDAPPPAEAATDVGQEEEPNFYSAQMMLEEVGKFALAVVLVGAAVVIVAFLAGRYV